MKTVLTIAGYDPSSGAGITADLMTFAAHSHFGTSAITSLTVQSTTGVRSSHPVDPEILRATLDCLHQDLPPEGVKIGMLATAAVVEVVANYVEQVLAQAPATPIVVDPVLRSSSGRELLSAEGIAALQQRLLPIATWVTPNLSELALLTGSEVEQRSQLEPAARKLQSRYPQLNILVTGGHLEIPDDLLLDNSGRLHWIPGRRIESTATHGTGCAFSGALLSRLLLGDNPLQAAQAAKHYVTEAIRLAVPKGHGHGPLYHLWPLRP